jgi:hypothetical protein
MAVTPRTFFQPFAAAVFNGVHDFATDTLKIALTNIEPVSTYANLSSISEIAAGGGYSTGGFAITTTTSTQSAGVYKLILADHTLTASGTIAEWRYAVLYNDTAAGDPLILWYTFALPINLASSDTFPFNFDEINAAVNFSPGNAGSGSVTLAVVPSSVTEDGTSDLVFTFTRSGVITAPLTVNYTIGGTAVNGTDYNTIGTSAVIGTGNVSADVLVTPIDNADADGDRTVSLQIAADVNYVIGTVSAVVGTIEDDDAPAFDPLSLSPAAWWDASDTGTVATGVDGVTDWDDKSGNGRHLFQGFGPWMPSYTSSAINGLHALEWPTTNNPKSLVTAAFNVTVKEVYVVLECSTSTFSNYEGIVASRDNAKSETIGGQGSGVGLQLVDLLAYVDGNNSTNLNADVFPEIESPSLWRFVVPSSGWATTAGLVVGMDREFNSLNRGWNGYIAEVLVFSTALSSGDRANLETYLMDKWGI